MRNRVLLILLALIISLYGLAYSKQLVVSEKEIRSFVDGCVQKLAPAERNASLEEWKSRLSGKKEDYDTYARMKLELDRLYSNSSEFQKIKEFKDSNAVQDPLLRRELMVMYNSYAEKQIRPDLLKAITDKSTEATRVFNTFRATMDGKKVPDNEIFKILRESKDRNQRNRAWEASKQVGEAVAPLLLKLVKLRNEAARSLGYENYYRMALEVSELTEEDLMRIFDDLAASTETPFREIKKEMDAILAKRYGINPSELRPWDYPNPFFQRAGGIFSVDLDKYFAKKDLQRLARSFYAGIGFDIEEILNRSDLFEKPGKEQHAFCTCIDRGQDIRILANFRDDEDSASTLLHEAGHGIYFKYISPDLPWALRDCAHTFTTEAIALLFERQIRNTGWLKKMVGLADKDVPSVKDILKKDQRLQELVFSRWCQVMVRFEQQLYKNPDQDLNKLWWDLVEKYQGLKRPEGRNAPDWAAKIHFATAPVYYHNYMLGEMMASQLLHNMGTKVLKADTDWGDLDFVERRELGEWLRKNIFAPGKTYRWDELLIRATGESLTGKYFAEQFMK